MILIALIASIVILSIMIWFLIPYSPLKNEFERVCKLLAEKVALTSETFSTELLSAKPELLQRYIKYCGLYNQPMMRYSFTQHNNADFLLQEDRPMVKMQYRQANFATVCERAAFINLRMAKILPFQGLDDNLNGKGRMKGVIAKLLTAFDIQCKEMDLSALVTVLAEGVACPSFLMHEHITWQIIDGHHLKATLTQYGLTVSGVFEFDHEGAILSFYTKDRFEEKDGTMTQRDWKADFGGYKEIEGLQRPTIFKATWIHPQYENLYFDCNDAVISYYY